MKYDKKDLRNTVKDKRKQLTNQQREFAAEKIMGYFLSLDEYKKADVVMAYMPIKNEVDTTEIIKKMLTDGKKVLLPITEKDSISLCPYYIKSLDDLAIGAYDIFEPKPIYLGKPCEIDIVIVPALAFDSLGNRLGYGKGYYDRFLPICNKAISVGINYDFAVVDEIITDEHDFKMDIIITEKGVRMFDKTK